MDGAFTTESVPNSLCRTCFSEINEMFFCFLFIAEIEVVMTKNSVVENIEQHPQLTFSKLVPENAKLGLHVT